jgi:hypothetical protein
MTIIFSGSSYNGFEFYKNDTLVGSARRKLNFVNAPNYLYWFDYRLNENQQEGLTAMIFVIVGFIK